MVESERAGLTLRQGTESILSPLPGKANSFCWSLQRGNKHIIGKTHTTHEMKESPNRLILPPISLIFILGQAQNGWDMLN